MFYFLVSWLVVGFVCGLVMVRFLSHERDVLLSDFLVLIFLTPIFGYFLLFILIWSLWDSVDFVVIKKRK